MVRAGPGGKYIDYFRDGYVAIGWSELGDISTYKTESELRRAYIECYGNAKPSRTGNALSMLRKFVDKISVGDQVISYSSDTRRYLVGTITGPFFHATDSEPSALAQRRPVNWQGEVERDQLSVVTRNQLGSTLTLFKVSESAACEIDALLSGVAAAIATDDAATDDAEIIDKDPASLMERIISDAHEMIKDKLQLLSPEDMEELLAALLRAMGFQTRVSPKGPDRGVDVFASPDGLGLTQPRIKAEVKHRTRSPMGAQQIRSFLAALREGDRGLYLSTGGFTKEARYEAERAPVPVTLVDIDDLTDLLVAHYENFDREGRALLRLTRVYWPAE